MFDRARCWLRSLDLAHSPLGLVVAVGIPVLSLAAGLLLMLGLPSDYFVRARPIASVWRRHPVLRVAMRLGKNLIGTFLVLAGLVMALPLVPGPGVLFVLVGIGLVDFPRKRALELRLLRRRRVLSSVNKMRGWFGRPALQTHESDGHSVVKSNP